MNAVTAMKIQVDKIDVEDIVDRFDEAVDTLRALHVNGLKPAQIKSAHPETINQFHEAYGYVDAVLRLPPPSAAAITRLDHAIGWANTMLSEVERRLVWGVAHGYRWARLGRALMMSRHEAKKRWTMAIVRMMFNINGEPRKVVNELLPRRGSVTQRVYFIEAPGGLVKIGTSLDVQKRIAELQFGSPVRLRLMGDIPGNERLERMLHQRFAKYRRHGEWFACAGKIKNLIDALNSGTCMDIALDRVEPLALVTK